jgi:hypothetical protein
LLFSGGHSAHSHLILLLTGSTVNIQSFIGTIFLVGIDVSNQVLLVDFANRLRAEGMCIYEAVVKASSIRLRPILMTAATLAAMLPMAIRIGTGAEANVPLARAVIGGLLFSLLLTRFVEPSLYVTLKGRGKMAKAEVPDKTLTDGDLPQSLGNSWRFLATAFLVLALAWLSACSHSTPSDSQTAQAAATPAKVPLIGPDLLPFCGGRDR